MSTAIQQHEFMNLPIKVSGGDVVARLSGRIGVRHSAGGREVYQDLYLRAENGGEIEVPDDETLYDVVIEALQRNDKAKPYRGRDPVTKSGVDIETPEGSQKESG